MLHIIGSCVIFRVDKIQIIWWIRIGVKLEILLRGVGIKLHIFTITKIKFRYFNSLYISNFKRLNKKILCLKDQKIILLYINLKFINYKRIKAEDFYFKGNPCQPRLCLWIQLGGVLGVDKFFWIVGIEIKLYMFMKVKMQSYHLITYIFLIF